MADWRIIHQLEGPPDLAQMEAKQAVYETARAKRDELRQQKMSESAIRRAVQEAQGDPTRAVQRLYEIGEVDAAGKLESHLGKLMTEKADQRKKQLETDALQWTQLTQSAQMVTPENYGQWRAMVAQTDPRLGGMLPAQYSPDSMKAFGVLMMTAKDRMDDERARIGQQITMRGQDLTAGTAARGQDITMRGQDVTAETARAGQGITVRGQDLTATTARRGQDLTASTARAGQGVTMRGQDMTAATAKAGQAAGTKSNSSVANIMNEIGELSKRINTAGGGPGSVIGGMVRRGKASAGMDNDVAEYEALVNGMIPMVARAMGHTGVLTDQDVASARSVFPEVGDNATLAKNKIDRANRLIQGAGTAATTTTTTKTSKYKVEVLP